METIMLGAIAGDIIGSSREFNPIKTVDFKLFPEDAEFTDDTVLSVATADAILSSLGFSDAYKTYGRKYPEAGYGARFDDWIYSETSAPYNSFGNGSAMRVSPVGWAFETLEDVIKQAEASAS